MRRRSGPPASLALILTAAVVLCTVSCTAPPGRAGTVRASIALRSVYGNGPSGVGADALRALLKDRRSPVTLTDVTGEVVPAVVPDSDGDTIAALRGATVDIAVVRTGRLAQAGAESVRPLEAPMVVSNDEQARRIAADRTVLRSLDGLGRIGLVGLALVPGGLRHPFGYGAPLRSRADFLGTMINTRPDENAESAVRALGAAPEHSVGAIRSAGSTSGRIRGIETSLSQRSAVDLPAVVTANVALYEKFDVIVIRAAAWRTLTHAQQRALRVRATADAAAAVDARPTEQSYLRQWCALPGGSSIIASASEVASFHATLDPVAGTGPVVERMRELRAGTTDQPGRRCSGAPMPSGDAFALQPKGDQTVLDGTWRMESSYDEILAATASPQEAADNAGVWTWSVSHGAAVIDQPSGQPCQGRLTVAGTEVLLDLDDIPGNGCGGVTRGTFRRSADHIDFTWTLDKDDEADLAQAIFGRFTRVGS